MGPCERCNIFRTASGGVTMTDSNRMLPACPQPITGKPFLSVQLVMKCRQALACCATGTCAKGHVKNSGTFSCFCDCGQWHGLSVVNGTYHNLSLLFSVWHWYWYTTNNPKFYQKRHIMQFLHCFPWPQTKKLCNTKSKSCAVQCVVVYYVRDWRMLAVW